MSNFGFVEFETGDVSVLDGCLRLEDRADEKDVEAACRGLDGKDFMGERYSTVGDREANIKAYR